MELFSVVAVEEILEGGESLIDSLILEVSLRLKLIYIVLLAVSIYVPKCHPVNQISRLLGQLEVTTASRVHKLEVLRQPQAQVLLCIRVPLLLMRVTLEDVFEVHVVRKVLRG